MPGPDVFDQLLPAKWRDIEFPVTRMRVSIAHDLVEHKYYGVDGARVESTGLAPMRFSFSAPLLNGISPGRNEKWAALYPNQMRLLLTAFQKKDRGMLQHPEFGLLVCKAERFDMDWDAARRGGVDAELSFVETRTDADEEIRDETPVQAVDIGDLDDPQVKLDLKALLELKGLPLPPYLQDNGLSIGEFANKIKAIADYPSLLAYRAGGRINSLMYQAKRIQSSVEKARTAVTWPVTRDCEKLKASAHDMRGKMIAKKKDIGFFRVPAPTTLAGVARQLPKARVGDLISLNPALMRGPEIAAGTTVRYYIERAA